MAVATVGCGVDRQQQHGREHLDTSLSEERSYHIGHALEVRTRRVVQIGAKSVRLSAVVPSPWRRHGGEKINDVMCKRKRGRLRWIWEVKRRAGQAHGGQKRVLGQGVVCVDPS